MTDPVSIISISVSLLTAIGSIILGLHLKKCSSLCCSSECVQGKTPPDTPVILDEPQKIVNTKFIDI